MKKLIIVLMLLPIICVAQFKELKTFNNGIYLMPKDTSSYKGGISGQLILATDGVHYKWNGVGWVPLSSVSGGGLSGGNLGSGWRLYNPPTQSIKTLRSLYGITFDSTTLADHIAINVDTSNVETKANSLNKYNILAGVNSTQDLAISNHTTLISSKVNKADSFYLSTNYLTRGTWSKDSSLIRALILLNTDSIAAHNTRIIANTNSINTKLNASDSVNYQLRYPDANVQLSSYTIVLSDAGKIVEINNGSSVTLTIPPNGSVAFPIGTIITVVQRGAGQITFTPGSGVTINSNNSWLRSGGQFSYMGIRKISSNTWDLYGNINP